MSKKGLMIFAVAIAALAPLALLTGRGAREKEPEPVTKEVSDEERRKIAAEWGRKGAAKSAEVRRAKKAAREKAKEVKNELSAQGYLRPDGDGQNVAVKTPGESPAET